MSGYVGALGVYGAVVAALGALMKVTRRRLPERVPPGDVVLIGVATHKISRILTKDAVTSPLRAPFAKYEKPTGSAELAETVTAESPRRHAVGELLTCPFCMGVWVATGLTAGLVLAPRATRLAATTFTAVAASDFLQMAYATAKKAAE
jgi:uncharacterized protein DUF1360